MKIPCRQYWVLWRMSRGLCRSDPHLAAMLAIFARLSAGEAIARKERAATSGSRLRRGPAWLRCALTAVAACARWVLHRVVRICAAVRWRFSRRTRTAVSLPPTSRV
jgi:hypothetical protein